MLVEQPTGIMKQLTFLISTLTLATLMITDGAHAKPPAHAEGGGGDHGTPYLSFSADASDYQQGETALLSWASVNTSFCQASGDWSGKLDVEGAYRTPPLDGSKSYTLKCNAKGGGVEQTINVNVVAAADDTTSVTAPVPTLSLSAAANTVDSGGSTTLSWTSSDADSCSASGAWSGARGTGGSESVGPLSGDAEFMLTCTGAGGTVSDSVLVTVNALPPSVSLSASSASIDSGGSTTLSWSASNATSCSASGGWSGTRGTSGSEAVSPTADTTYSLSCTGDGGTDTASVAVTVNALPPELSFSAAATTVASGGEISLTWSASHTDSCSASGGWSGSKSANGTEVVGPLSAGTTFTLSCSGPGGNVVEMLTVSIVDDVSLSWEPPTENIDGSALTDLAGYRLYVGQASGSYTDVVALNDATATSHTVKLASGSYYVVMTAVDADGNESAHSNEVTRTVP